MENSLTKKILISASMCDNKSKLGLADTFDLFMDIASEHAEHIGLGGKDMAQKGLFWLTVRTKIQFHRRPEMMETPTVSTWPGHPGKLRCERYYTLKSGDEMLVEGKTEWAVLEIKTGKLSEVSNVYPDELVLSDDTVCCGGYVRMSDDFAGAAELERYRVRSTDIDLGGHMNNVAYVRVLMGSLSTAELENIRQIDVCFRASCFENEVLTILRRQGDGCTEMAMLRPDGKTAILARIS